MSFKLGVVKEAESGELSIKGAARKYGIQNHSTVTMWLRKSIIKYLLSSSLNDPSFYGSRTKNNLIQTNGTINYN